MTGRVTYLILDIVEELPISDYPITVRLSPDAPEKLFRRVAEVQRHGGGTVAVYNEPLVLKALTRQGYPPDEVPEAIETVMQQCELWVDYGEGN